MDVHDIIDYCRVVKGAVTVWSAMDDLDVGDEVFILMNSSKNLAVIKGELVFLQYVDTDSGEQDVKLTIEFRGTADKPVVQSLLLGSMLNGYSRFIGDEEGGNMARLFSEVDSAVKYFEIVQFVREIFSLEKTASVSTFVSRLLNQQKKPKPE